MGHIADSQISDCVYLTSPRLGHLLMLLTRRRSYVLPTGTLEGGLSIALRCHCGGQAAPNQQKQHDTDRDGYQQATGVIGLWNRGVDMDDGGRRGRLGRAHGQHEEPEDHYGGYKKK